MAYNRQPNVVFAGTALKQNPPASTVTPPGIVPVTLDANIATTTSLGVVQVGAGLAITPAGVLSATGGSPCAPILTVKNTSVSYTAVANDCYIGATHKDITITLPLGIVGKVYIVKNQAGSGNITVKGTGQNLDQSGSKTLGNEGMLIAVFDGTRWSLI
jgi:hypothetical protein